MIIPDEISAEQVAFEAFAELHPVECFEYDRKRFCAFVRIRIGANISDKEIEKSINQAKP